MNIKRHLPWLGALLLIINAQADTNPNVVIIYIGDMDIGNIDCCGRKFVAMPNIDKLAQNGLLFNQYYSSALASSPLRCGLTTRLSPIEVGVSTSLNDRASSKRYEQRNYLNDRLPSMVRAFQNTGYATGHIGKWHMGGGRDVHNTPSVENYEFDEYPSIYESPDSDPVITASKWIWCDNDNIKRRKRTEHLVDKSINFIKHHKDSPLFPNLWPDDMRIPQILEFRQRERKSWKTEKVLSSVLGEMDKQIGRFTKTPDDMGLSENTIITFTSDNGPVPSFKTIHSAYLRGTKNSLYEGDIRMPLIVKYPKKIKPDRVNSSSVLCTVNLHPTLCFVAGIKTEKDYKGDGQSCAKVLLGKSEAKRETDLMWDFGWNKHFGFPGNPYDRNLHLAIRGGRWKLLVNGGGGDAQLYDMELDRFEKNSTADEHPELVTKLSKKVYEWYTRNKDKGLRTDL